MQRREEQLHRAAVAYLRANLPKPWFCAHVPNGGGRSKAEAAILKALGVLAGMPDLLIFGPERYHPDGGCLSTPTSVIAIEFKAPPRVLPSGKVSKARARLSSPQLARQADLGACGVPYLVVDDLADMIQALKAMGVPLKGRVL